MAQISRQLIDDYTKGINTLSVGMQSELADRLALVDFTDPDAARDTVIEIMQAFCAGATDAAATLAARFYEIIRAQALGYEVGAYEAYVDSGRIPEVTTKAVSSFFASKTYTPEKAMEQLLQRVDFEIKRAAGDCIFENGRQDKQTPRYARVPSGSETCMFCLMLASRGFVYTSKLAAGELGHYHPNCDCRIVPSWNRETVQDYHPKSLYMKWQSMMDSEAEKRAKLHGTSARTEYKRIYADLERGAERAKIRHGSSSTDKGQKSYVLYERLIEQIESSPEDANFRIARLKINELRYKKQLTGRQYQKLIELLNERQELYA